MVEDGNAHYSLVILSLIGTSSFEDQGPGHRSKYGIDALASGRLFWRELGKGSGKFAPDESTRVSADILKRYSSVIFPSIPGMRLYSVFIQEELSRRGLWGRVVCIIHDRPPFSSGPQKPSSSDGRLQLFQAAYDRDVFA